jgi:hypothetical protein
VTAFLSAFVLVLGCLACAKPIVSEGGSVAGDGVSYALPRNLVKLTVVRTGPFDTVKAKAQIELLTAKIAEEEKRLLGLDEAVATLLKTRALVQAAAGEPAREAVKRIDERVEKLAKATVELQDGITRRQAEIRNLEKQKASNAACFDTLSLALLPAEPDPKLRFVAKLEHSMFRDDKWAITTTTAGLLSSTDATITDRTADVVVELAKSAAQVAKTVTMFGFERSTLVPELPGVVEPQCMPFRKDLVFDPADGREPGAQTCTTSSSWKCANARLAEWGIHDADLHVDAEVVPLSGTPAREDGFHYRRPIPYTIVLRSQGDVQTTRLLIPNGAPIDTISIPALTFVTAKYGVKFDQGMLISVDAEQPSEAMAIAAFPGRVAKELVSIPTDLVQIKIDHSTKEAEKIAAEKGIVDAKKALLESEMALERARTAPGDATPTAD